MIRKELTEKKQQRMNKILEDLKARMREIDELGRKISREQVSVSPKRTRELLEEIKVPSLELLKEKR